MNWICGLAWLRASIGRVGAILGTLILTVLLPLQIGGCGGGGGGGARGGSVGTASGLVVLPSGFSLPMARLAVTTVAGQAPLSKTGSFTVPVTSPGPHLAQLIDTVTNKIVLLGYVDGGSSGSIFAHGNGQISSATTADALLFLGLSGPELPFVNWETYLESIASSTMATTVAATVASSVGKNPTAISDGDTAILNVVSSIQSTAIPPPNAAKVLAQAFPSVASSTAPHTTSVARVTLTRAPTRGTGDLISVDPTEEQSGMEVEPNPKGDGIVLVNSIRRRSAVFIYEVAKGQTVSTTVPLTKPIEVVAGEGVAPEEEMENVKAVVIDGLQGKFSFLPEETEPILLSPDQGSPVTVYDVVVVGPAIQDTMPAVAAKVAPNDAEEQVALVIEWSNAETLTIIKSLALDVVVPVVKDMILEGGESEEVDGNAELDTEVEKLISSLSDVKAAIVARDFKTASEAFFKDVLQSPELKASLAQILKNAFVKSGLVSEEGLTAGLERLTSAITVMGVINKAILTVDITRLLTDSTEFHDADDWVATVLPAKVTLSPNPATVNDVQNIAILTAQIQGETDLSQFRFKWSLSGTEGALEEPNSSIPMPTGVTAFSQTAYVADLTKLKNGNVDTVTVTAYSVNDVTTPLGTATAQVKAQPGMEAGSFAIDSTDVFPGLIKNDPWVLSAAVTMPFVEGATSYIVEAAGALGTYSFYVNTPKGGALEVLDVDKKPYPQYVATGSGVVIALFGMDHQNAILPGAVQYLQKRYPITTVRVTYN